MNKRNFIKSLGALAVGCMMAGGLSWKPAKIAGKKVIANPEWVNAKYEISLFAHLDAKLKFPYRWPTRSNNPNAIRDNDFILPFITVDA